LKEFFDLEAFFKNGPMERSNFLSRVLGIFNEEIVRIWCRDPTSPYVDLGRPTLYGEDGQRWQTLDFALAPAGGGLPLVTEMKCEIAFENFRYLRLENSGQLDHHRGKAAFDWFMDLARNPQQHPVKIGGEETSVGGSVLVWGSVDEDARPQIMEETGLNEILSLESIVQDLLAWGSSEMEQFISAKHDWLNELFIELNPVGTARFRGLMNGSTSPGSTDTELAQIDNSDDQPYSTVYGLNSAIVAL
jgi:hypothetical protein